jgi:hypothetical protein
MPKLSPTFVVEMPETPEVDMDLTIDPEAFE